MRRARLPSHVRRVLDRLFDVPGSLPCLWAEDWPEADRPSPVQEFVDSSGDEDAARGEAPSDASSDPSSPTETSSDGLVFSDC